VIDVDITRSSLNRFPIFAAMGVPEVWRFDGDRVNPSHLYVLGNGRFFGDRSTAGDHGLSVDQFVGSGDDIGH